MQKQIPSTTVLLAFEATARHLSFTRAASELNLTQTAISHRIKGLEDQLKIQLFIREQNRVRLTEHGREYLNMIRPALARLSVATDRVAGRGHERLLRIACMSAFAIKCLLPALTDFRRRHADITIRISPLVAPDTIAETEFDVGICHGSGEWDGFGADKLGSQEVFPVCSPRLISARKPLRKLQNLHHHTIIRTFSPVITDDWPAWLEYAGLQITEFPNEMNCDGAFLALEAALSGLGIFIGRTHMVRRDLAEGRLVEPFRIRMPSTSGYYLVVPTGKSTLTKVQAFRAWALAHFQ